MSETNYVLRKLNIKDVSFEYEADYCDIPLDGNVLASGDDEEDLLAEQQIQERLNSGDMFAWCRIEVTAKYKGFSYTDSLSGVTLAPGDDDIEKFAKECDMHNVALEGLQNLLNESLETLKPFIKEN